MGQVSLSTPTPPIMVVQPINTATGSLGGASMVGERKWLRPIIKDINTWSVSITSDPTRTYPKNIVTWKFRFDETDHVIILSHSLLSGKRKIVADGRVLVEKKKFLDNGSKHAVWVLSNNAARTECRCKVIIRDAVTWNYDLEIFDQPFQTAKERWLAQTEYIES